MILQLQVQVPEADDTETSERSQWFWEVYCKLNSRLRSLDLDRVNQMRTVYFYLNEAQSSLANAILAH